MQLWQLFIGHTCSIVFGSLFPAFRACSLTPQRNRLPKQKLGKTTGLQQPTNYIIVLRLFCWLKGLCSGARRECINRVQIAIWDMHLRFPWANFPSTTKNIQALIIKCPSHQEKQQIGSQFWRTKIWIQTKLYKIGICIEIKKISKVPRVQDGAPKIAKSPYKWFQYGLW